MPRHTVPPATTEDLSRDLEQGYRDILEALRDLPAGAPYLKLAEMFQSNVRVAVHWRRLAGERRAETEQARAEAEQARAETDTWRHEWALAFGPFARNNPRDSLESIREVSSLWAAVLIRIEKWIGPRRELDDLRTRAAGLAKSLEDLEAKNDELKPRPIGSANGSGR